LIRISNGLYFIHKQTKNEKNKPTSLKPMGL